MTSETLLQIDDLRGDAAYEPPPGIWNSATARD
jgi:hypothetical protein